MFKTYEANKDSFVVEPITKWQEQSLSLLRDYLCLDIKDVTNKAEATKFISEHIDELHELENYFTDWSEMYFGIND